MGKCVICGENAGMRKKAHPACQNRVKGAEREIMRLCLKAALRGEGLDDLPKRVRAAASRANIPMNSRQLHDKLSEGWGKALQEALSDDYLSDSEVAGLNKYRSVLNLSERELNRSRNFDLFRSALILSSLHNGVIPRYALSRSRLPFNLMKSEEMIQVFEEVEYVKEVTRRHYKGSSMGVSVRVAKGVYIRPGSFEGRTIEQVGMELQDTGTLGLTTKHLYYTGENTGRSFRVKLEKIVAFNSYKDGLRIMRDTASAKPEVFVMRPNEAWFLINAVYAVLDLEKTTLPAKDAPTVDELVGNGEEYDGEAIGHIGGFHSLGG